MFILEYIHELIIQLDVLLQDFLRVVILVLLVKVDQPVELVGDLQVLEHPLEEEVFQLGVLEALVSIRLY